MKDTVKKYLSEASNFMFDATISEAAAVDKKAEAVVIATEGKKEDADKKVVAALSADNLTKWPNKSNMFKKKKKAIKEEDEEDIDADTLEEEDDELEDEDTVCEDEDDGSEDGELDELGDEDDEQIEESVGNRTVESMGPAFAKMPYDKRIQFINDRRKALNKSKHVKAKEALQDLDALEKDVKSKKTVNESYIAHASRWM